MTILLTQLTGCHAGRCDADTPGACGTDADGDGFYDNALDCDDDDPDVHPDATETPADGIDSNCDGDDDTYG